MKDAPRLRWPVTARGFVRPAGGVGNGQRAMDEHEDSHDDRDEARDQRGDFSRLVA
jgi:hypothetical protein